jgi:hypothetical protein
MCLLCLYSVATDSRPERLDYARPVALFHRWVEAPIAVDPGCRSFYVKRASAAYTSRSDNMWSLYAGDAMFISLRVGLPTLNGYSAWGPAGWELTNPQEPAYPEKVQRWIKRNNLKGVCELDIEARTMRRIAWNQTSPCNALQRERRSVSNWVGPVLHGPEDVSQLFGLAPLESALL